MRGHQGVIHMLNMDQNKIVELISEHIISKYMQNLSAVKSRIIKLYSSMPFTGAPNISDAQLIVLIEDLEKFVSSNYRSPNN